MELTLLGTTAVLAFLVVGAAIMLVVSFRRTVELRGALIQTMRRIERLESAIVAGAPLEISVRQVPTEAIGDSAQPRPRLIDAQPTIDEITAAVEASDRIDPPHLGVLSFGAGLAAFAAMAAARVDALSGGAGLALATIVGLIVVAAAEWRLRVDRKANAANDGAALRAALLGVGVIFAALLYARYGLGSLHAHTAVLAMSALALFTALLSLRFGPWMLGASLPAAALAPALSPIGAHGAWGPYAFLFGFTALALLLSRRAQAPIWAWGAAAIALFWGANAAVIDTTPFNVAIAGIYLAGIAALGLSYAWASSDDLSFPRFWEGAWPAERVLGHAMTAIATVALTALLLRHAAPVDYAGWSLILLALGAIVAFALRPGLWLAPILAATAAATAIAFWTASNGLVDAPNLLILTAALGLIFSLGGWAAMMRAPEAPAGAAIAAIAPVVLFAAAFWRVGGFGGEHAWASAALAIGALNVLAHLQLRATQPGNASAFAAGAALAGSAALATIAPAPYQPLAFAAALPLLALIDRWRSDAGLRFAAGVICVLLFASLVLPQFFLATASPPVVLAALFLPCAAGAWIASLLFSRGPPERDIAAAQTAFALALLVAAACASLMARHTFTGGDIAAPYASLAEAGLNTLIWLGFALVLAWRFGARPRRAIFALEFAAFAAALTHAIVVQGVLINPWWGYAPAVVLGWGGFDLVMFAFAAPGLLFLFYAWQRSRQGYSARAATALGGAVTLLFVALILELRLLFHGAGMATEPLAQTEAWTYSIAMLGFAALLLAAAAHKEGRFLRYASLALALAALAKMAFSDLGALNGLGRIGAFLLIAAAAGGVVFLFRRFVLPPAPARPKTLANADPVVPPS